MKRVVYLLIAVIPAIFGIAIAQGNWNNYQPLKPGNQNYAARLIAEPTPSGPSPDFQATFYSGSTTAEIGVNTTATFSRASSRTFFDGVTQTDLATVTTGNPALEAFGFLENTSQGGIFIGKPIKNQILQSQDAGTTWSTVGTGSVLTDTAVAPDGNTTADSIVCLADGDGIAQATANTAASKEVANSVFVKTAAGTLAGTLFIEGSSGGTPGTVTKAFTATTTWQRVCLHADLGAGVTGNVNFRLECDAAGTLLVWGMQTEYTQDAGTGNRSFLDYCGSYVPTTTAAAASTFDALSYNVSNITDQDSFTVSAWVYTDWDHTDQDSVAGESWLYAIKVGATFISGITFRDGDSDVYFGSSGKINTNLIQQPGSTWTHYVITHDFTNDLYYVYQDGVEVYANTGNSYTSGGTLTDFAIGWNDVVGTDYRPLEGIISDFRYYTVVLTPEEALALYDDTKGNYGF